MSNIQVQFRRGTTTQHNSFAGAQGEVTVDTDLDTLMVHTGGGAGTGVRLAKHSEIPTGGGGTVTSVDSGTGLTGGPITTSGTLSIADNGVTFAKMQDINTAKVIGRTTAGSGNPEEVSILDEDTMTSNSATALATQQSIKAYVDSQVGGSGVSTYDSGWVTQDNQTSPTSLANTSTLTFTHSLGAIPKSVTVYVATSSAGANNVLMHTVYQLDANNVTSYHRNCTVSNVGTSDLDVVTGSSYFDAGGTLRAWGTFGTHIRVIAIA